MCADERQRSDWDVTSIDRKPKAVEERSNPIHFMELQTHTSAKNVNWGIPQTALLPKSDDSQASPRSDIQALDLNTVVEEQEQVLSKQCALIMHNVRISTGPRFHHIVSRNGKAKPKIL